MTGGYEDGPLKFVGYYCGFVTENGVIVRNDILKFFPDYTVTAYSYKVNAADSEFLPKLAALNPASKGVRSGEWRFYGAGVTFEFRSLFSSEAYEAEIYNDILTVIPRGRKAVQKPKKYRYYNKFDIEHGLLHDNII